MSLVNTDNNWLAPDVDLRMMPIVSEVEYRGWSSPTWSGGGILPILATTSLSRTRKRYLANFRNIATLHGMLRPFPPLQTRMCCSSSDVMEACASLTRAERACLRGLMVPTEQTAVNDCQHKWAGGFNFQVQHLANIYWACVYVWSVLNSWRRLRGRMTFSIKLCVMRSGEVVMLLQSETFFLIMSAGWAVRGN